MKKLSEEQIKTYIENDSRCPWCNSSNIFGFQFKFEERLIYQSIECNDCKAEWEDEYTITGISYDKS